MAEARKLKGKPRVIKIAAIVAVTTIALAACAFAVWTAMSSPKIDPGATVIQADSSMTREEVQAMLDEQVQANMMDISLASEPVLKDGSLSVNVKNPSSNSFAQRFEVVQDGNVLYESGVIDPGHQVEKCAVSDDAHEGEAMVTIYAVDVETDEDHGNPTSIKVSIINGANE